MTSAQMKAAFKIMQDFAPAIMKATEILEAAEQAESILAEHKKAMAAVDQDCEACVAQKASLDAELSALRADVERAKQDTAEEKERLAETLKATKEKLKAATEALDATQKDHANTLAAHKQEPEGTDIVLETKRKELADFRVTGYQDAAQFLRSMQSAGL